MALKGVIDGFEGTVLRGWITDAPGDVLGLMVNEFEVDCPVDRFYRADLDQAGISDGDAGFAFHLNGMNLVPGEKNKFSVIVNGKRVIQNVFYVEKGENLLDGLTKLIDAQSITKPPRLGLRHSKLKSNQIIGNKNLNDFHRIAFWDTSAGDLGSFLISISLNENKSKITTGVFGIVLRSQFVEHVEFSVIDGHENTIFTDIIACDTEWRLQKVTVPSFVILSEVERFELSVQQKGKGYLDIASIVYSDNVEAVLRDKEEEPLETENHGLYSNGSFKGIKPKVLTGLVERGTEVAENWFIEYAKRSAGLVHCALKRNDAFIDPASVGAVQYMLEVGRNGNGYCRLYTELNKEELRPGIFELVLENTAIVSEIRAPELHFIARTATKDGLVVNLKSDESLRRGLECIHYELSKEHLEALQKASEFHPVIVLAIDIPADARIAISSIAFKPNENVLDIEDCTNSPAANEDDYLFEDDSINRQLGLLKGLDNWTKFLSCAADSSRKDVSEDKYLGGIQAANFDWSLCENPIDILIPIYNAHDDVYLCIKSVIEQTDFPYHLILINDGDDPKTEAMLKILDRAYPQITLIKNPQNLGYTKSVNVGLRMSQSDWCVILNSDTIVTPGWLKKLYICAQSDEAVGMVGPLSNAASWQSVPNIREADGDWSLNPLPPHLTVNDMASLVNQKSTRTYPEVRVINGFCQFVKKDMLKEIGLLDEFAFPKGYGEENDMCARAVKAGYKLKIADDTYIWHSKSKSFGHRQRKELAKLGSEALKKKHPDVDWSEVTKEIFENQALQDLRSNLAKEFSGESR